MIGIYHNRDQDGYTSGAILKRKYPDIKLVGWDYSETIPWALFTQGEEVIMIDISFKMPDMMKLLALTGGKLTWIDHHVSAYKEFEAYEDDAKYGIQYVYEADRAACEVGWKYFFPDEILPESVLLIGQYDTWRLNGSYRWNAQILPFQMYMRLKCSAPEEFPVELWEDDFEKMKNYFVIGKSIMEYQAKENTKYAKQAFGAIIGGLRAICLNTTLFSSNTFASVWNPDLYDFMLPFAYMNGKWKCSMYTTKPDVDCSELAKARGGGGHKQAAGFEVKTFEEIFL